MNCFFYEIFEFLHFFPTVGKTFCNTAAKTLDKLSNVPSAWTTKIFEESVFSEEKIYFYFFFEFWCKSLQTSVGKPSAWFEKLLSTLVQGIFLHNIIIFLEKLYAYRRTLREKGWTFVKFLWHGGQNCFLCVQRTFLKNSFSFSQKLQIFQLFSDFEENLSNFWRKSSCWVVKTVFKCPGDIFGKYFWSWGTNCLDFRRKFCDRFVKTPFYVSSGDFWLDCFFYDNFWIFPPSSGYEEMFLAFWRKSFKKFFRTAIYVYKKYLWKIWFLKKLLQFFRVLINSFAEFCQKFLVGENYWIGLFSSEKNSCLPTEVEGEGVWCSVRTFGRFVKSALYVSERVFRLN